MQDPYKMFFFVLAGIFLLGLLVVLFPLIDQAATVEQTDSFTAYEAGFAAEPEAVLPEYRIGRGVGYTLAELREWQRPDGPLRVGLQVGHLDNDVVPEELSGLIRNGAGATAGGYNERDTVAVITEAVATLLRQEGIVVDILPATVPPGYVADAFISIHADGNPMAGVRGFKIAGPRRDYSGRSSSLVAALETAYAETTDLPIDPQVTRRMSAYYAFNWPRYEHAIHPFTPAAIVETGFLTNPQDRALLINEPERVAKGIAGGIEAFLEAEVPANPPPALLAAPTVPLSGSVECAPVRAERRDRDERPCEAALRDEEGFSYLLVSDPVLATSSLSYQASVDGVYTPVQMLNNYFWFPWEVRGVIEVTSLRRE